MILSKEGISNRSEWILKGYHMPDYDRELMIQRTKQNPYWVHFGAGNISKAYQADIAQKLIEQKIMDRGIIVVEGFDYEIIESINRKTDDLAILVTLKANGEVEKSVIESIAESLILDSKAQDYKRTQEIFANPSLQMASFTITEKGYCLTDRNNEFYKEVQKDMEQGPALTTSYIGKVASLLYTRFRAGAYPIAMVSMDNCSHNGEKLYKAVYSFAETWEKKELVNTGFTNYLNDVSKVSFPWTMIDKITPRPDEKIADLLHEDGIEDMQPLITKKNSYVAGYVNAEECGYLVVEDSFPNGRPDMSCAGVIFTDNETVIKTERMKVCTCLNPLHTSLAVFGCLLGFKSISAETTDPDLAKMIDRLGYEEGMKVVSNPGIIKPEDFLNQVLKVRLPNPFMPDTPQRIATDTSQKLPIRFGETIKSYQSIFPEAVSSLKMIPLVFAGWIRYLTGIDDEGRPFTVSSDPMLQYLNEQIEDLDATGMDILPEKVIALIGNEKIFGVNLYQAGLGEAVEKDLLLLLKGPGSVRRTLREVLSENE